jgi:glycosyltransferase involved in cell wall biosynthesis
MKKTLKQHFPVDGHSNKVALVYDRVNSWGGAERVLQELHTIYPNAPLFTSVYSPKKAQWARGWDVRPSWLQKIPGAASHHQWLGWAMPLVFESLDLSAFDLIISVTSEAAKGVITRPGQLHVCYLLTPTRYLWSHQDQYTEELPGILSAVAQPVLQVLRKWDYEAAQRPDYIIPISERVKERAEKYYQRAITAPLYPPLTSLPDPQLPIYVPATPFILSWGRHVRYKAFDILIKVASQLQLTLVLAGAGPDTNRLVQLAQQHDPWQRYIHFVGTISDAELSWYIDQAQAAIFPQEEDFGIAPMEAVGRGCPVLVHERAGAAELLALGRDGIVVGQLSATAIAQGIMQVMNQDWDRPSIAARHQTMVRDSWQQQWHQRLQVLTNKQKGIV